MFSLSLAIVAPRSRWNEGPVPLAGAVLISAIEQWVERGTQDRAQAFSCMINPYHIVEYSIHIAWDYLEATGDLGDDPEEASQVLLSEIQRMVRGGVTRPLVLSNRAIEAYKRRRHQFD